MVIRHTDRFRIHPDIVLHHIAALGKTWAFNVANGAHYTVNETAYWIFDRLGRECSLEDMVNEFVNSFEVTYEAAEKDLRDFIIEMSGEGLIDLVAEGSEQCEKGL